MGMAKTFKYLNKIGAGHACRQKCDDCQYRSELCERIFAWEKEALTASAHRIGDTLCWCCKHATPNGKDVGCSWSNHCKPVEGWKADGKKHKHYDGSITYSYNVRSCPQFERRIPTALLKEDK